MATYRSLEAWRYCHELYLQVHKATRRFPTEEKYGLISQIRRASFSAAANIVEGAARPGPREFSRFLAIALGSLAEVQYGLHAAHELGYLEHDDWAALDDLRDRAGRCTWGLFRSVKARSRNR